MQTEKFFHKNFICFKNSNDCAFSSLSSPFPHSFKTWIETLLDFHANVFCVQLRALKRIYYV